MSFSRYTSWRSAAKAVSVVAAFGLLSSACGAPASDGETITLTYSTVGTEKSPQALQSKWFMDEVAKRSDGKVKWKSHFSAALLSSADTVPGLADGRADAAYYASAYAPQALPLYDIGFVPVADTNPIAMALGWRDLYEDNKALQDEAERAGIKFLIALSTNSANIGMKKPMKSTADLKGKQIRSLAYLSEVLKRSGAEPVVIPAEEVHESIERGVLDGVGGYSIDSYTDFGLQEIAPWVHSLSVGIYPSSLAMGLSLKTWNKLPDDVKKIMEEVQTDFYDEFPNLVQETDIKACDALLEAGGGVIKFPQDEAEATAWRESLTEPLFDAWIKDAVRNGVDKQVATQFAGDYREAMTRHTAETDFPVGTDTCAERTKLP